MKIFAAGIGTETNTFSTVPTGLADFTVQRARDALEGRVNLASLDLSQVWGGLAARCDAEFVCSLNAWAQPSGVTVRSAYEPLRDELLADLRAKLPVDVVLLALHGAMVAQGYDDCEEDIIARVRTLVGPEAVIGVIMDLHCQMSESKIGPADVVITYKEYPHVDINERARELFALAVAARRGEVHPMMALFDCRMMGMYPTSRQPLRGFVDAMSAAEGRDGVLSISFGHGFQFADVPHAGAKVLVVADGDRVRAQQVARQFGLEAYRLRAKIGFDAFSLPLDEALMRALSSERRPVIVADQSDNVGSGAPGDSTFVLRWLLNRGVRDAAIAILYDPEVVRIAKRAGVGARLSIRLGGKMGRSSGDPIDVEATVLSMRDHYLHGLVQRSGDPWLFPVGDVVALRCEGIDVVVGSERCQCLGPSIFTDFSIDPGSKRMLIVKSYQHFHDAFASVAGEVIYMCAPGAVPPDPRRIPYRRLDTSRLYPWVEDPLADAS